MKKYFYLILLFIFLFPTFVFAEEVCDGNGVSIKSIELDSLEGTAEELNNPTFNNNMISIDLKMYDLDDSVTYKFVVKNTSDKDYIINENSIQSASPYIVYSLDSEDHSHNVEKGTEKEFSLTATYVAEVDNDSFASGSYDASSDFFLLSPNNSLLINPSTGNIFLKLLVLLLIIVLIALIIVINNKRIKCLLLLLVFLVPISIYADCELNVKLDSNVSIGYVKRNPCTYSGDLVQGAEYINGQYVYHYKQQAGGTFIQSKFI